MSVVTVKKRPDGVAVLLMDQPGSPVNILSPELLGDFRVAIEDVLRDPAVKACVLASAKKDFIAGADLKRVYAMKDPSEGSLFSREGHTLLDLLADSPKPFVAAISGLAVGGGLEVALACRYLLAADSPETVLALPEVTLGLLPGGGGTQRLPRRVGLPAALNMMLTGQRIRARKAFKMGLVDGLTSPGGIEETACRAALLLAGGRLRALTRKKPVMERLLESPPGRMFVFKKAREGVMRKTHGLYPAPLYILDCVETGFSKGFKAGVAREVELFGRLCASPQSKGLIGLFLGMTELKKPSGGAVPRPVKRLGILGGGFMGAGIASVSLKLAPAVVKDASEAMLKKCGQSVREGLSRQVKSGAIGRFDRDRLWARFWPALQYEDLARCDLVIEAVFEDLALKQRVLREWEAVASPEAVFASNTSALPIGSIAEEAAHPERVLGMHYFSPVPKMPLLELVRGEKTAPWAVATAREFGAKQGKTVIVVKDSPGFYTTRILSPFLNEAVVLLEEGAAIEEVDRALVGFGYPVGPITLLDEVGIDVGAHVSKEFGSLYESRGLRSSGALSRLFEAGYQGRKNKRGFYRYDRKRKGPKPVNREIYTHFGGEGRRQIPHREMADRLSFLMTNEAVWCLQEEVIACPRDGDVGAILGLGFPPFRGGPFRYLDALGLGAARGVLLSLCEKHGERFKPAPLLDQMAREGRRFYPEG